MSPTIIHTNRYPIKYIIFNFEECEKEIKWKPVTMAVSPEPSIPCVTSSAVEEDENPEGPFLLKSHMMSFTDLFLFLVQIWRRWQQVTLVIICKH